MGKKHHGKNIRIAAQQPRRSFWDTILYDGEKEPWREVFSDPILRLVFCMIVGWIVIMGFYAMRQSHCYVYHEPYVFKIGKMEPWGGKILLSNERIPLVCVPIDIADNLTIGDSVTIIEKINGTGHRIIESVEVRIHA